MTIVPLEGIIIATPIETLKSLEEESANAMGLHDFVTVDSKSGRNDSLSGKSRVRLFKILKVYENARDTVREYEGKNMYCVCFENESENNIIVDKDNGNKLWFISETSILGYETK